MGKSQNLSRRLANQQQTEAAGAEFAKWLLPFSRPVVTGLSGPLGAGKTTFARGLLRALGVAGNIKSPTYTLIEPYATTAGPVYHLDLYRLVDPGELDFLGLPDFFAEPGLVLVEWPEKAPSLMKRLDYLIMLDYRDEQRQLVSAGPGAAEIGKLAKRMARLSLEEH